MLFLGVIHLGRPYALHSEDTLSTVRTFPGHPSQHGGFIVLLSCHGAQACR